MNISLDGVDAYHLKSDDLVFANTPKNIQNLAGLKDASGTKRLIIIQPGDDVKAKLEAAPNGSWVLILPGEYSVSSAIDLSQKKNLRITGFGWKEGTGYNPTVIKTDQNIRLFDLGSDSADNIIFENLLLKQTDTRQGDGIRINNSAGTTNFYVFRNVGFHFFLVGIRLYGGRGCIVDGCYFDDCYYGVLMNRADSVVIRGSVFFSCKYYGIDGSAPGGRVVSNSFISCATGIGIRFYASAIIKPNVVALNTFKDSDYAMKFYCASAASGSVYPVLVSNCVIIGNSTSAIGINFRGDLGLEPTAFSNIRFDGTFNYGFYQEPTITTDFTISLLTGIIADTATFNAEAFHCPNAQITEIGHNVGFI
ncbi:MAG: hypothetical protein DRP63_03900 [Planctomycetota bacterium]|nr:MAG: hypothetical protein DRP63_03900 [Planctomycetota bacterium]